jgi:iron complex transport system permease protein
MEAKVSDVAITPMTSAPRGQRSRVASRARALSFVTINAFLLLALFVAILVSVSFGAIHIPVRSMLGAIVHRNELTDTQHTILFAIRLPRVLASALVGAALSVSGLMFQGLFRNPMADPYIIGASGGAGLGAAFGIVFLSQYALFGFSGTALLAFAGAVLSMAVVYLVARNRRRTNGITLLLAGFAVGTMLTNSTYLFEVFDPNSESGTRILAAWLHGAIGVPTWPQLAILSVMLTASLLAAYPLMRRLNTLALGDEYAEQLGIRVEATRVGIILVGSLLTAIAVSLGGLISFAGLIVPHMTRLFLGPDHIRLLPVTALAGALFLVLTDTLARTIIAPTEIPVGLLMVFLGGPFFLYLLRKNKRDYIV